MTEIIFYCTPKRANTVQRGGSIYGVVRFGEVDKPYIKRNSFPPRQLHCNRRITNIILVVARFGRKPLCPSGRIPTRSQYSLRRRAMIFTSILPACATSEMPLQMPHSVRSSFLWIAMMMASFHCYLAPPPNTNDDIEQSPVQGGIAVEGDLEQLNGDSVRSDSFSVHQRADSVCQLLHRGLNSERHVFGPLVKAFCMFGPSLGDLALRRVEPTSPSFAHAFNVPQENAVLVFDVRRAAVSLPFQVHRRKVLVEAGRVAFSSACFEFAHKVPKEAARQPCAPSGGFLQPSSRPFEGCCCARLFPDSRLLLFILRNIEGYKND